MRDNPDTTEYRRSEGMLIPHGIHHSDKTAITEDTVVRLPSVLVEKLVTLARIRGMDLEDLAGEVLTQNVRTADIDDEIVRLAL